MASLIGIIILNYFSGKETLRLYQKIESFQDESLRKLVVDNSADATENELLRRSIPSEDLVLAGKNLGYAGGNNLGIRLLVTDSEIRTIVLINPDVELKENIFHALGQKLLQNNDLAAIGPRLCLKGERNKIFSDGGLLHFKRFFYPGHLHAKMNPSQVVSKNLNRDIGYVNGSFFMIRVSALEAIGLLNEKFFLYFEETEWCHRAKTLGWQVASDTTVTAYQDISNNGVVYEYYMTRNHFLFHYLYYKKGLPRLALHYLKHILIYVFSQEINSSKKWPFLLARIKGIVKGLMNS
ncbi:glycosyltransferase family 2 protein [uncultured Cyclobacterium sp.]|uniref:glycosyltransferase family 2 protein n=1 Tax=uncultured Cyclobacterium sp. TaxID=453820 RepID=UPI0030EE755B|tara:strand:- start:18513 stop:19397 length:885 start_codon:yes stop_codon:yes gene_type:complete